METIFFWIIWGAISFWALKTFYLSFSKEKLERLRKAALSINLSVLVLTFLPWLPSSLGGESGIMIAFEGNPLALLFLIILTGSIILFALKGNVQLKVASIATIANTLILFIIMFQLRPATFALTPYDIAPIIAVLFFLIDNVVVLLLWQQLQLKRNANP